MDHWTNDCSCSLSSTQISQNWWWHFHAHSCFSGLSNSFVIYIKFNNENSKWSSFLRSPDLEQEITGEFFHSIGRRWPCSLLRHRKCASAAADCRNQNRFEQRRKRNLQTCSVRESTGHKSQQQYMRSGVLERSRKTRPLLTALGATSTWSVLVSPCFRIFAILHVIPLASLAIPSPAKHGWPSDLLCSYWAQSWSVFWTCSYPLQPSWMQSCAEMNQALPQWASTLHAP